MQFKRNYLKLQNNLDTRDVLYLNTSSRSNSDSCNSNNSSMHSEAENYLRENRSDNIGPSQPCEINAQIRSIPNNMEKDDTSLNATNQVKYVCFIGPSLPLSIAWMSGNVRIYDSNIIICRLQVSGERTTFNSIYG